MSIYEEIQGWLEQIRSEVRNLQVLLDNEQDEVETVHLVVTEIEVKAGNLQVNGTVQAAETVSVGDLSRLVEKFSRHLENDTDFSSLVKGAVGDQGAQGEAGSRGPTGDAGNQGPQGRPGTKGPTGDSGNNRYRNCRPTRCTDDRGYELVDCPRDDDIR
ncbi:MAG: collagen-like protein [Candidatus Electrothrix sp. AX2]|nr:collagen-like protein [Candidatus Electrothrix gigas]